MDKDQPKRTRSKRRPSSPQQSASSGRGGLTQNVRTAKGRRLSSTRWLERQLNDPYVAAAKERGLRSRAAFKLEQMDEKFGVLKNAATVVDLGAAPGGWSQIVAERCHSRGKGDMRIIAVDLQEMEPVPGVRFLQMDFTEPQAAETIKVVLGGEADCVLSDMAAPATGHKQTDHLRIVALFEAALEFAVTVLRPGGSFVAKVLQGGTEHRLLSEMKKSFQTVRHFKPDASRTDSAEIYVVGLGFRG